MALLNLKNIVINNNFTKTIKGKYYILFKQIYKLLDLNNLHKRLAKLKAEK